MSNHNIGISFNYHQIAPNTHHIFSAVKINLKNNTVNKHALSYIYGIMANIYA